MSGKFNRMIAANAVITANAMIAANAVITADAVIAANAVKLDSNGKMASDNPALLTGIV